MIPTMTLGRFINSQGKKYPGSTGELSDLLTSIALGCKIIGSLVATAGIKGLEGYTGNTNVQGEATKVLDEQSDQIFLELLSTSGQFGLMVSEEQETVVALQPSSEIAKYVVSIDPLDGSSNLGTNIPVGTIFGIFKKRDLNKEATIHDYFQTGRNLIAAGYTIYGARTCFVYSVGDGVHGFTLDPQIGEFVLTDERIVTPNRGKTYSANEGNWNRWSPGIQKFISELRSENKELGTPYTARYAGSLVADFDRNLKNGGVFLYPADSKSLKGKLRLLYECMPLAFIAEQAGGRATDGRVEILDLMPEDIHQRVPFIVGSKHEVDWFQKVANI